MRKLATVRQVSDIRPIEDADFIELAIVDGWQCVVGKDNFEVGDTVVYCEVDTVLPVLPEYEFLRKSCYVQKDWLPNGEGFRLRTMKLRGQVSQGLLLTIGSVYRSNKEWVPTLGEDLTDALGIVKWDPPLPPELEGKARGRYPTFIPKTSQERVQNIIKDVFSPGVVTTRVWEVSIKLDGESCTFYHNNGEVGVCSRTVDFMLDQEGNYMVHMFHKLQIGKKLAEYGNIAIQGELIGPGIHGNREGLNYHTFYAFDIWDIDAQRYVSSYIRNEILSKLWLDTPPILASASTLGDMGCTTLEDMLRAADQPSLYHKVAEGLVFKDVEGSGKGRPRSFKCINNRYLLGQS